MLLFKHLPKSQKFLPNKKLNKREDLYHALPARFSTKEAADIGTTMGITDRTVRRYLKAFLEVSFLKQLKHGMYEKKGQVS